MRGLWIRLNSAWRALTGAEALDRSMDEEMRFHLDMEAERLGREQGLEPREAQRRAHVAFGGLEKFKEAGRDTRGLRWLDTISLDARLGVRMLIKYRGLTLVGGFAMAVAVAVGATAFEAFNQVLDPALPFEAGDRIVALRYATPTPGSAERRVLHDFLEWRSDVRSIEQLGAFRTAQHNLVIGSLRSEPVKVAEISASGFVVAQTPPLLGRYLLPDDEREGAPSVLVIGYDAWQSRFAGDPLIVGRAVVLGGVPSTVVGVMPKGFAFPLDHQYWIPFRPNPLAFGRLQGPAISIFGRLAPGAALEEAQAELTAIGRRAATEHPVTHAHLRPVVLPYTHEHLDVTNPFRLWFLRIAQLFIGLLSFVVAVNLAILVYARTVTRIGEIAVRTALGASRRRILLQLFIEALALAAVGAGAGLLMAHAALVRLETLARVNGSVPFWIDFELSIGTVIYTVVVAVVAAALMGVLPGIKATSGRVNTNLREPDARSGARLGAVWTTLIVAQVGVAVAMLPLAVHVTWQVVRMGAAGPDFAADRFLVGVVAVSDEVSAADVPLIRRRQLALVSRLDAEPGVTAVTFSSGVPGFAPGRLLRFEDPSSSQASEAQWVVKYPGATLGVNALEVALNLFETYDAELLAGRGFGAADQGHSNVAIVNRAFVREFLSAGTAPAGVLGVRFRYVPSYERRGTSPDASYQVVGVVDDFPRFPLEPGSDGDPTIYHPAAPGEVHPIVLTVRFGSTLPEGLIDRFRTIGAEVDPALQLRRVLPLAEYYYQLRSFWRYLAWGIGLITVSVLLLSAAGMYALMSFTVAQRTREIAIRAALGADSRRLLFSIFGRATRQLALGLAAGSLLAAGIFDAAEVGIRQAAVLVLIVSALMTAVGLLAASGPARRGLRIDPSDALRTDM
jgi:predicted permease